MLTVFNQSFQNPIVLIIMLNMGASLANIQIVFVLLYLYLDQIVLVVIHIWDLT